MFRDRLVVSDERRIVWATVQLPNVMNDHCDAVLASAHRLVDLTQGAHHPPVASLLLGCFGSFFASFCHDALLLEGNRVEGLCVFGLRLSS